MKNVGMIIILIWALTLTLVSTAIFSGIQQVRAEDDDNKEDKQDQVNTESQQINKCENNSQNEESDLECNNIVVYGVVCMPGAQCILDKYEVPFELVTPF
jgi:mannitol-specific phosphotransferase system IIBC component